MVREKTRRRGYLVNGMVYVTFVPLISLTVIAFAQSVNVRVHNPGSLLVMDSDPHSASPLLGPTIIPTPTMHSRSSAIPMYC